MGKDAHPRRMAGAFHPEDVARKASSLAAIHDPIASTLRRGRLSRGEAVKNVAD